MSVTLIDTEAAAQAWLREVLGIDDGAMARLSRIVELLVAENQVQNLVAQASLAVVWQRHIVDSAQLLLVSRGTLREGSWLDLGTGAGFPGLVIAALQPERAVTLVDSRRLRTEWLSRVVEDLGLTNVSIVQGRVEDLPLQTHAVISARAFAPLEKLVTIAARFSTPETIWLLPKGAKARHELSELPETWRHLFHVEQSITDRDAGIIAGQFLGGPISSRPVAVRPVAAMQATRSSRPMSRTSGKEGKSA
ncbi:16S rRNA (guanine(527)-N(7))-methyltransferase RsmG [Novosphingobium sp. FKTRR1]|uniref:16S rRNA (guanine(527)-N(7))-methyltransferase RsmG n=1 Tax=Novosphingobium sp. FKTRR1 TaxID=2879118 RepID=UPI001CF05C73|nr:16S rRNA (guanine(527)-N(7))-methyltransferase RsmG [Novosphingobium sp. FKTRR1]